MVGPDVFCGNVAEEYTRAAQVVLSAIFFFSRCTCQLLVSTFESNLVLRHLQVGNRICRVRVNYGVQPHIKPSTRQWQIPIGLQLVPGGFIGLGMLLVKESARWLAKRGRNEEASQTLIWVRGGDTPEVRAEFDEILAGL